MVVGRGVALAAAGVGLGRAAFAFGGALEGLLFGVTARDPSTFLAVVALLFARGDGRQLRPGAARRRHQPGGLSAR